MTELATNLLYYGDNLDILRRYLPDAAVDLVYLDPPFNSNRDDNVIFRDESGNATDAQLLAFEDTWHWGPSAEATYAYLTNPARHEGRVPDKVDRQRNRRVGLAIFGLVLPTLLAACGGVTADPQTEGLPDREFAWCLGAPGAVGAVAADSGVEEPLAAQAVVDDGIYDDAGRWRYHDAWDQGVYAALCSQAYVQFDGASHEVDLAILRPDARDPSPSPTANVATSDLRVRAREFLPSLATALTDLNLAIATRLPSSVGRAADDLIAITGPELEALTGAVAEGCFEDAGAAYGMALSNADTAATYAREWAQGGDGVDLEIASDFLSDANASITDFNRLDSSADC